MEKVQEMVLAAQEGDREAFSWLYQETYNRNYYIVIKMVKHEQDAMDVLQDAYVKVIQKLFSFRYNGSKSFTSWTSKVASHTALDFLRKKNPILFTEMQGEDDGDTPVLEFEDESVENQPEITVKVLNSYEKPMKEEKHVEKMEHTKDGRRIFAFICICSGWKAEACKGGGEDRAEPGLSGAV